MAPATGSELMAAAQVLAKKCNAENRSYLICKQTTPNPGGAFSRTGSRGIPNPGQRNPEPGLAFCRTGAAEFANSAEAVRNPFPHTISM